VQDPPGAKTAHKGSRGRRQRPQGQGPQGQEPIPRGTPGAPAEALRGQAVAQALVLREPQALGLLLTHGGAACGPPASPPPPCPATCQHHWQGHPLVHPCGPIAPPPPPPRLWPWPLAPPAAAASHLAGAWAALSRPPARRRAPPPPAHCAHPCARPSPVALFLTVAALARLPSEGRVAQGRAEWVPGVIACGQEGAPAETIGGRGEGG